VSKETHCYVYAIHNFPTTIANGGVMKCGSQCENVKHQIGEYHLKYHMFVIEMGGFYVVLGAKWLRTMGVVSMDFKNSYMIFTKEG
jgi:hypothetical protein